MRAVHVTDCASHAAAYARRGGRRFAARRAAAAFTPRRTVAARLAARAGRRLRLGRLAPSSPASSHLITSVPSTFTGVDVAPIIGANTFYANGYTGGGTIASNIEAGHVWNGHETLGHVTQRVNEAGVPERAVRRRPRSTATRRGSA